MLEPRGPLTPPELAYLDDLKILLVVGVIAVDSAAIYGFDGSWYDASALTSTVMRPTGGGHLPRDRGQRICLAAVRQLESRQRSWK
jgi:hypothetical protein